MTNHSFYNFLGLYNKAYKTAIIKDEKEFGEFLNSLKNFWKQIDFLIFNNYNLSEETYKDEFDKYILQKLYVNSTHKGTGKNDLIIEKGGLTQAIFEFKKPSDNPEMLKIGDENINKKVLHEAVRYFYNQDSIGKRQEIKHVIITDTNYFFFFDTHSFSNDILKKVCKKYVKNSKVADNRADAQYEELKEAIREKNIKFLYEKFDLIQYKEKILNGNLTDADIKRLKYFYKALHPDFLLREFSPKDSNELNSKFYNELLYILGLEETGKGQRLIKPSETKGTLRDRICSDLTECNRFDDILNLIIIWINRLLFLKLFESQLISFNNDDSFSFLNFEKISDFSKLNKLFFNILGKPIKDREDKHIPYLNSSLFERAGLEAKYGNISNLDSEKTLKLYKGSVLSKDGNYPENPVLLKYLLDFLEAYSFSSNISEENKNKEIINSSVLGLIFEKLNGYKDGSFFTPGHITEYMAENAINNVVLQKYKEYNSSELCNSIEDLKDIISNDKSFASREERKNFYSEKLFNNLKICDPAVGSGHFLVSALNCIIALKSRLGLLPVSNKAEVQNDSLVIYEEDGETQFQYKRSNKESQKVQKAVFDEKRKIIENCLFGVDINPNSVEISRLRLWIELLKSAYYIDNTDEMQILPNIDINIKEGNSLVSAYNVRTGHCALEQTDGRTTEAGQIREYKYLVKNYKKTDTKEVKNELKEKIKAIKDKLFPIRQLKIFENSSSQGIYKNSMEWMIEFPELLDEKGVFQGFDIVISNPPYGILNKKQNQKVSITADNNFTDYLKDNPEYKSALSGMMNIYKFFILRSFKLLKKNGYFIQILPLSFACDSTLKTLRRYIFDNYSIIDIEAFPERDSPAKRVFEHAKVSVCILSALNRCNKEQIFCIRKNDNKYIDITKDKTKLDLKTIQKLDENLTIPLANKFDIDLLLKIKSISKSLRCTAHCYTGEIDISVNAEYITNNSSDKELIKGAVIDRYIKKNKMSQGRMQFLNAKRYLSEIKAEKAQHHLQERIVMQGLTGINEKIRLKMTLIPSGIFCANSVNYLYFSDEKVNKKYILSLLNSSLLNYIFKISSTNSNVNGYEVDSLPVAPADETIQNQIADTADKILKITKSDDYQLNNEKQQAVKEYENQIDLMVYKLYDLTYEEVSEIDKNFNLAEEEYKCYMLQTEK